MTYYIVEMLTLNLADDGRVVVSDKELESMHNPHNKIFMTFKTKEDAEYYLEKIRETERGNEAIISLYDYNKLKKRVEYIEKILRSGKGVYEQESPFRFN
jgi:hypothetical protein